MTQRIAQNLHTATWLSINDNAHISPKIATFATVAVPPFKYNYVEYV